jgi:hypothetical protein
MEKINDHGNPLADDDDDDWYNQMEQYGHSYGDFHDGYPEQLQPSNVDYGDDEKNNNEDLYYSRLGESNISISDHSFRSEHDMVWQHLARQFLSDSLDHVSKHASRLTTINPDRDACSVMILQQWLFTFFPQSLKLYNSFSNQCTCFHNENQLVYVDNKLHTSFIALCSYSAYSNKVMITAFSPYRIFDAAIKFMMEILEAERQRHKDCRFQFSGIDIEFHENVVCKLLKFHPLWVEYCGMYVLESKSTVAPTFSHSFVLSDLQ